MNAANLDRSERLKRVLRTLRRARRPISTMEIIRHANVMAVSAAISELRTHGYTIPCQRVGGRWFYKLER